MGNAIRTKHRIRSSPGFVTFSCGGEIRAFHGSHPPLLYLLLSGSSPRNIFPHRFSDPDLSGNRSMLMAKGKAVIHLGIVGTEPADLPLGRASANRTHGTYHGTILHQTLL